VPAGIRQGGVDFTTPGVNIWWVAGVLLQQANVLASAMLHPPLLAAAVGVACSAGTQCNNISAADPHTLL
jgi:hypothetical protein